MATSLARDSCVSSPSFPIFSCIKKGLMKAGASRGKAGENQSKWPWGGGTSASLAPPDQVCRVLSHRVGQLSLPRVAKAASVKSKIRCDSVDASDRDISQESCMCYVG